MMGRQPKVQKKLFYAKFNLDRHIRKDRILRKIDKHIHFDFILLNWKLGSNLII